ncbi:hypothetical protein VHEMI00229 [[Torrubiella] hemipterigena]|uniref:SCP domain-containing protein n=1 Tax=[Torrubiella] hemipterigena TaxID=1531966 RepID=A0A0A1T1B2_9HYPO|nr:hypothetical protein VHEMI00229 [[Torrubiella] hemipterigena]
MFFTNAVAAGILALATASPLASQVGSNGFNATQMEDFKKEMIMGHSWYRKQHSASEVIWSDEVASAAQDWANQCSMSHKGNNKYGENLAWGSLKNWAHPQNMWGSERTKYNWANPGFSGATGHFTQMVWKKSTHLGCGVKKCSNTNTYVVCQYDPKGNIMGGSNFKDNVGAQVEGKIDDVWPGP